MIRRGRRYAAIYGGEWEGGGVEKTLPPPEEEGGYQ